MNAIPPKPRGNGYPTSDGKPMAETDLHRNLMITLIALLELRYRDDPNVYVSGNLLLFYEEGNRRRHVSPDVMVTFGVPKRERDNYLMWEEGRGPDVVIELTSSSTHREDIETKMALYRDVLRVREYLLFDPLGDWLEPRLQGYRRRGGQFVRMRAGADGRLRSRVLGVEIRPWGRTVQLYDAATGELLLTPTDTERLRALRAEERAIEAETENERLRRELEELRRRVGN